MKPFLRLRMAIKRNAKFDSDSVRDEVLNLIDSLESDLVSDITEGDEIITFSSFTEDCTESLYKALLDYEESVDDPPVEEDEDDDKPSIVKGRSSDDDDDDDEED